MISINTILLSFLLGLSAQSGQSVAKLNTFEQNDNAMMSSKLDYIAMEVRSALNYQTETLATNLDQLVQILTSNLVTRDILPQVLRSLEDVGLVKEEMARTREDMKTMLARTTEVEGALEKAKKELKKVKKDSKSLFQDLETLGIQVADERIKMSVYFDAVRNDVFETPGNLTYTSCNVNQGLGMNISNGFFTAPTAGTYLFTFHANTVKGNDGLVLIRHNAATIAGSYDTDNYKHNTLAQTALAELRLGDRIWVEILSGGVRSNDNLYIHFVGMLLHP